MSFYRLVETFTRRGKRLKLVENGRKRNHLTYSPGFHWRRWNTFYLQIASLRNKIIFRFGFFTVFPMEENGRVSLAYIKNLLKCGKDSSSFFSPPLLQPDSEFLWGLLDLASCTLFPQMLCCALRLMQIQELHLFQMQEEVLWENKLVYRNSKADSFSLWQRGDSSYTVTWKTKRYRQSRDAAPLHSLCRITWKLPTTLS